MEDDKIRKTGIDIIGDISWGTHICLFYQTTNDLLDILVPYFKAGLENNEFCMWITSDPLNVENAKGSLKRAVKNLDEYLQKGQIEILDYSQWYIQSGSFEAAKMLQGWVEKEAQSKRKGFKGFRLTGNTFWLEKGDWKEFIEYERIVDQVINKHRIIAICTYSLDKCGASEVIDVVSSHQSALIRREGRWEIVESATRKGAKQSQSESEERFHAVAKSANEAIVITDNKCRIVSWNKGAQRIFLYDEEEILGQNVSVLMPERYRALHLEAIKLLNSNGQTRLIGKTYEAHGLRKDGSEFPIEISLAEGKTAKSKFYATIMRDITEHKRAEEALRYQATLLTNLNDAIIASDEQNRITAWNPAAELIYGWKTEEVLGRFGLDITQTEYPGVDKETMLRSIAELGQWRGEATQVRKDGSRFPVEVSSIVLRDENGRTTGYLSLNRDIIERKRVEHEILCRNRELSVLYTISRATAQSLNLEETLNNSLEATLEVLDVDVGGIYLLEPEGETLTLRVVRGVSDEVAKNLQHVKLGEGMSGGAAAEKKPIVLDVQDYPSQRLAPYIVQERLQSLASTPLLSAGQAVGAMNLATRRVRAFPPEELELLTAIGQQLGSVVQNAQLYEAVQRELAEYKRAEEALVKEQYLLSALMDNLPDHIYFKDTESRFTRINKATAEWLGLSDPAQALGKTDFDFFSEDHARSTYEDELGIIRTGQALVNIEERETWSDRPDTWVSTTKLPLRDKEGRIIGTFGVSRDITERKRAEQGLKLQSQVLENMVEGVNVSNENGIIIFNNPAFEIMFGHAPGELIGQHVSLLLNSSPEETLRRVSEIIAQLRTKGTWLGEISNRKKDGIPFTTYARISALELSGNKYWISVQEDITERKRVEEAEREQHALAEALCDTAVALNSTLHLDDVLDRILTNVGRVVPFDAVNIMLVESGIARIIRHQGYKEHGLEGFVDQVRFDLGDLAGLHYMTETKRPIVIPDTQTFTQWVDIPELRWIRSYVSSPICFKGETVGFLNLDSATPEFFTPIHAKRLETFAAQAAIAIENAQLYEEIEARHRYLGTLLRINTTLRSTLPPNIVLETISRSAGEALGYVGSLIIVPDGNNERLILGSIWGSHLLEAVFRFTGLKVESFSLPVAAEGNPIIRAFQSGEIQLQSGELERIIVDIEPSINPKLAILIGQAMGAKLVACVPLLVDGEAVGVLIVFSPRERLSDEERALLLGMADQAGLAITNARTFEEVRTGRERLQNLSHQLVEAQESERRHIARELHDEIGQVLTFLKLSLEMCARLPPDAIKVNLEEAKEMVSELLNRVRILSHDLRPAMLDDLGLLPALLWLFERYTAQTKVQVDFKHTSQEGLRFSPDIETAAYRIVQEALTNVARHANMSQAIVRLWTNQDRLNVQIEDHGTGFDPVAVMHSRGSSGLIGMSERVSSLGGQLRVESSPGIGTCIIAELPLG